MSCKIGNGIYGTPALATDGTIYVGTLGARLMAVDADGHPHIIYLNLDSTGRLRYAHWDGTQWQIETVVDGWVEWYPSLALDAAGRPHISYYDGGWNDLWYAWWGP